MVRQGLNHSRPAVSDLHARLHPVGDDEQGIRREQQRDFRLVLELLGRRSTASRSRPRRTSPAPPAASRRRTAPRPPARVLVLHHTELVDSEPIVGRRGRSPPPAPTRGGPYLRRCGTRLSPRPQAGDARRGFAPPALGPRATSACERNAPAPRREAPKRRVEPSQGIPQPLRQHHLAVVVALGPGVRRAPGAISAPFSTDQPGL